MVPLLSNGSPREAALLMDLFVHDGPHTIVERVKACKGWRPGWDTSLLDRNQDSSKTNHPSSASFSPPAPLLPTWSQKLCQRLGGKGQLGPQNARKGALPLVLRTLYIQTHLGLARGPVDTRYTPTDRTYTQTDSQISKYTAKNATYLVIPFIPSGFFLFRACVRVKRGDFSVKCRKMQSH